MRNSDENAPEQIARRWLIFVLTSAVVVIVAQAHGDIIVLGESPGLPFDAGDSTYNQVQSSPNTDLTNSLTPFTPATTVGSDIAGAAGNSSSTTLTLTQSGFSVLVNQIRSSVGATFSNSFITFYSTDSTTDFQVFGTLTSVDPDPSSSPFAGFTESLYHIGNSGAILDSEYGATTLATGTRSFGGGVLNGSASGHLTQGVVYTFNVGQNALNYSEQTDGGILIPDQGATANGTYGIGFADSALPLPSAAWGGFALLTGLGMATVFRRKLAVRFDKSTF
jgi:hypothetical protein